LVEVLFILFSRFYLVRGPQGYSPRELGMNPLFFTYRYFVFYLEKEDPKNKGPGPGLGVLEAVVILRV
jgi:hypothetical protein